MTKRVFETRAMAMWLLLGVLLSCGDDEQAGGTASEGETFIYGTLVDSNFALRKSVASESELATVYLAQLQYDSNGLRTKHFDSTHTDSLGRFQLAVDSAGIYAVFARSVKASSLVQVGIEVQSQDVELGHLGMHASKTVLGSFADAPECSSGLQVAMPGITGAIPLDSTGTFSLTSIPSGRSLLVAQCGDSVQQWRVVLPGFCNQVDLHGISWTGIESGAGGGTGGTGGGPGPGADGEGAGDVGFGEMPMRIGKPLVVGDDCALRK